MRSRTKATQNHNNTTLNENMITNINKMINEIATILQINLTNSNDDRSMKQTTHHNDHPN